MRGDDGQAVFLAQPVAHIPYAVIAALVGIVLVVAHKIDRTENDMVMNVSLVYVSGKDVVILPICYRIGKLLSDFMGFLIVHFPLGSKDCIKWLTRLFPRSNAGAMVNSNSMPAVSGEQPKEDISIFPSVLSGFWI